MSANSKSGERAALLHAPNEVIGEEDRDFQLGPSCFMTRDAERDDGLARIWWYSILPLLEEHNGGRLTRDQVHRRFGLAAIQAKLVVAPGEE